MNCSNSTTMKPQSLESN